MSAAISLTGLRVLVTRPTGQGEALVSAIEQAGGVAVHCPLMEITALDTALEPVLNQRCKQLIMQLDQFQHIIFISSNAVYHGMEWINQYWPQLPVGINWYGIGSRTCSQLQAAGVPVVVASNDGQVKTAAMNSEALLQQPLLQQIEGDKVLIIRGVGGREYLQQQLSQRGAVVSYAECYQRLPILIPERELLSLVEEQAINSICISSGEGLENLCQRVTDKLPTLNKLLLVVPSKRVASMARAKGFEQLMLAENATDNAAMAALVKVKQAKTTLTTDG
jgi:uroporphyrinogen-III synthase